MAAPTLSPPPLTSPMAQQGGGVAPAWAQWFQQLGSILRGALVPNDWASVTAFANSWATYGGLTPRYRKDADGVVWLSGALTGGASNATAFTLPAGFRPDRALQFGTFSFTGTTAAAAGLKANADGTVVPYCPGGNAQVWLDGVAYRAAG